MGLLSHIAASGQKERKAGGLLAKAENAKKNDIHSFQEWAFRNGFEHCGVFSQIHGMMVLTNAYGIDSHTIANSVSSKDFWNGTLNTEKRVYDYKKTDQEFYNFVQFFPFEIRSSISAISFIKTGENKNASIVMIFRINSEKEISITDEMINSLNLNSAEKNSDFSKFEKAITGEAKQKPFLLYSLDIDKAINNSIKSIQLPEATIRQAVTSCIFKQIFDLVSKAFPEPNFVSQNENGKIKLAVSDNGTFDDLLLQSHINLMLKDLLCDSEIKPALINCGTSNDSEKIISFLNHSV
ncbi:MAG: hypothetical protein ACI4LX_11420 [Treponema sp.]